MNLLPDIRVWRTANEYQEAASLCDEHEKYWAAAVLAALAIEIYLKSFLSKEVEMASLGGGMQIFKETEQGHNLEGLFGKISQPMKALMIRESHLLNSKLDLEKSLTDNKNIFVLARYPHEQGGANSVSNSIVRLAEHMRELVIKVANHTHPKS